MSKKKTSFDFNQFLKKLQTDKASDKRKVNERKKRKYFLIVCEGEKTEPNYFKAFQKLLPKNLLKTIEIKGVGANTKSVVAEAIRLRTQRQLQITLPNYDEVWAVFDRDSFPAKNVNEAIRFAQKNNVNVAFSNEAFELWYLLHFIYFDTGVNRKDYILKLEEQIKLYEEGFKYEKNDANMYRLVEQFGNQKRAIKWAEKLEKLHVHKTPTNAKPSTSVYKLVKKLNDYITK